MSQTQFRRFKLRKQKTTGLKISQLARTGSYTAVHSIQSLTNTSSTDINSGIYSKALLEELKQQDIVFIANDPLEPSQMTQSLCSSPWVHLFSPCRGTSHSSHSPGHFQNTSHLKVVFSVSQIGNRLVNAQSIHLIKKKKRKTNYIEWFPLHELLIVYP